MAELMSACASTRRSRASSRSARARCCSYVALYRSGLLPRWLSAWGVLGAVSMLTACVLALWAGRPVTGYVVLALPIAVQEMVLAGWLLVRGFAAEPVRSPAPALA